MIQKELLYLLEKNSMTYQELAEKADIPLETMRNLYYGKVKDPKASTLLAISKVLKVSINRLMGERLYTHAEERLIMNYRRCGHHGKSIVMLTANFEADLTKLEREADKKYKIPCIIPLGVVHDGLRYGSGNFEHVITDNPDAYMAIECTSNRLAPTFCKGDKVLIEDRYPENGETAVFVKDGIIYCRKYIEHDNGYILESLNWEQYNFRFKRMDKIKCMGTCIGIIRA